MCKNIRSAVVLVVICLAAFLNSFAADVDAQARNAWMTGFLKFKEGVVAEEADNAALALRLFREAREQLRKVQTDYPGWQPDVVAFRLGQCESRIKALNADLFAKEEENLSRDELITRNRTLKAEAADYQEKLAQALEKIELMKARPGVSPSAAVNITELKETVAALEEENRALMDQLDDKKDSRAVRKLKSRLAAAKKENEQIQQALEEAVEQRKILRQELDKVVLREKELAEELRRLKSE